MKDFIAKSIFFIVDALIIWLSIYLSYYTRVNLFEFNLTILPLSDYLTLYPLYIVPLLLFFYEGLYTRRYDFWQESRLIFKAIIFSLLLIFAYLAMTKNSIFYSRLVIVLTSLYMAILIPSAKSILKKLLFKLKLWQKEAKILENDSFLSKEIYSNHYLGYIKPKSSNIATTVFINSKNIDSKNLSKNILKEIQNRHEVIFVPLVDNYDLTHSKIYQLFNTRTNLIVFQNRLKSSFRVLLKELSNILLTIIFALVSIPIMAVVALIIKRAEPKQPILFKQKRLGKNGEVFVCYKFRTMQSKSRKILKVHLQNNPQEIEYFKKYHKYKKDPRVTKIGAFLRKSSLDELPQLLNIVKREMSLIGPRPYMISEKKYLKSQKDTILSVKPGVTGLWQVSGRSKTDFKTRIEIDKWYVNNWSIWLDFTILLKTFKAVIKQEGSI